MAPRAQGSQLKRGRPSADDEQDSKKPRRSERISSLGSKEQTTPLKTNTKSYLPSPLTHHESTTTEAYSNEELFKDRTQSPEPSQVQQRTSPQSSPTRQYGGLSSPPGDTQLQSQFVFPGQSLSYEVEDEEGEGVWGYIVPLDSIGGDPLVCRARAACPAPYPEGGFGRGTKERARGGCARKPNKSYNAEEWDYERNKRTMGFPAGGYLIGRHPECDRTLSIPIISNRHCIVFNENKSGKAVAILEDLSSNGTFVNGAMVGRNKRRELQDNDEISILDQAKFIFYYPRSREGNAFKQQYRILQQLGKGHFATVFLCIERATGFQFAVKRFEKRPGEADKSRTDGLQQEIGVLKSVSHPNVLCLKDTFDEADGVYLVLELAPEGELFNCIVMKQKLTEEETRKLFVQLFQGIKYLHERNIVHRDIKPENILLADKDLSVKLADFGLAKIIGEESFTTTLCGTPSYVAPEILQSSAQRKYTRAVDVWSLGVVLYICLCGFPPFSDELRTQENPYSLSQQIKMGKFDYPSPYWDSVGDPALDLIDRMLTVDVERRIGVDECLEHPWITGQVDSFGHANSDSQNTITSSNGTTMIAKSQDSMQSLSSHLRQLDFSKRKPARERTLLSSINDIKISKIVEVPKVDGGAPGSQQAVMVFEKNSEGKRVYGGTQGKSVHGQEGGTMNTAPVNGEDGKVMVNGEKNDDKEEEEEKPDRKRGVGEFMQMGGKGDRELFDEDGGSRYLPQEVP